MKNVLNILLIHIKYDIIFDIHFVMIFFDFRNFSRHQPEH